VPFWLAGITLPQSEVDTLLLYFQSVANTDEQRRFLAWWTADASAKGGRSERAKEAMGRFNALSRILEPERDTVPVNVQMALDYAESDRAALEAYARQRPTDCRLGLSRVLLGDTTGAAAIIAASPGLDDRLGAAGAVATVPRGGVGLAQICVQILRGAVAALTQSDGPLLHRADSMMLFSPLNAGQQMNYDLGVAFARRGEYASAAAAVRRRWFGHTLSTSPRMVIALRQEGRWAALAGDTAAAIKAYRQYLLWRETPEPALIPQRDSVRAELTAVEKSYRKSTPPKRPTNNPPVIQ
jgi:hypothetical protein